jgi:hypothetical protein
MFARRFGTKQFRNLKFAARALRPHAHGPIMGLAQSAVRAMSSAVCDGLLIQFSMDASNVIGGIAKG